MQQPFDSSDDQKSRLAATKAKLREARIDAADARLSQARAEAALRALAEYSNTLVTTWKQLRTNMGECKAQLKTLQEEHEMQDSINKAEKGEAKLRQELADVHAQLAKVESEKKELRTELEDAKDTLQKSQDKKKKKEAAKETENSIGKEVVSSPPEKQTTSSGFVGGVAGTSMGLGYGNSITGMGLGLNVTGMGMGGMSPGGMSPGGMGLSSPGGLLPSPGGMNGMGLGLTGGAIGGMGLGSPGGMGGMGLLNQGGLGLTGGAIGGMGLGLNSPGGMTGGAIGGMGLGLNSPGGMMGGAIGGMGLGLNSPGGMLGSGLSPVGLTSTPSQSKEQEKDPHKEPECQDSKPSSPKVSESEATVDSPGKSSARVSQSLDGPEVISIHSDSDDDSDDSVDMPVKGEGPAALTIEELINFERTLEDMAKGIADIVVMQAQDAVVRLSRRSQRLDTPRSVTFRERVASILEVAPRPEAKPVVAAFKF